MKIDQNVDVNVVDHHGRTNLHIAAEIGDVVLAREFLSHGVNVNKENNNEMTALQSAWQYRHQTGSMLVAKLIWNHGVDIQFKSSHTGNSLLHWACKNNIVEFAKMLIDAGAEINSLNNNGDTPLHSSINAFSDDASIFLIENGANINIRDGAGSSPLNMASFTYSNNVIKHLIKFGANVNSIRDDGGSPLYGAICVGNFDIANILLSSGADVNTFYLNKSSKKMIAINEACLPAILTGKTESESDLDLDFRRDMEKLLIAYGADVNFFQNGLCSSPLVACAELGLTQRAIDLIDQCVDKLPEKPKTLIKASLDNGHHETAVAIQSALARKSIKELLSRRRIHPDL